MTRGIVGLIAALALIVGGGFLCFRFYMYHGKALTFVTGAIMLLLGLGLVWFLAKLQLSTAPTMLRTQRRID